MLQTLFSKKAFKVDLLVSLVIFFCLMEKFNASVTTLRQPLYTAVEKCRQETGATEADFEALLRKSKSISMPAKCMRACLMKQFNLMDSSGKFNRDVALRIAGEFVGANSAKFQIANDIVTACSAFEVSENHCEAAEQYNKCASKQVQARGISHEENLTESKVK